jgi:hypothetical protein
MGTPMARPTDSALQQNGGRTPSAWGGFQRCRPRGPRWHKRIGKIAAA